MVAPDPLEAERREATRPTMTSVTRQKARTNNSVRTKIQKSTSKSLRRRTDPNSRKTSETSSTTKLPLQETSLEEEEVEEAAKKL
jgi:hypothetical protein